MKSFAVGDLVRFPETGYTGVILADVTKPHQDAGRAGARFRVFIHGEVHFMNPTYLSLGQLGRCAEVISASR
jgi:hypothetical protein